MEACPRGMWCLQLNFVVLSDLLTIDPHTPTPEPVRYDKKDGKWYTHDGVDVQDTQQRKGVFLFLVMF